MARQADIFRTHDIVRASGIYKVLHAPHSLQAAVMLFKKERFPKCSHCDSPVIFMLVRRVDALDYMSTLQIPVPLLELVPLEREESPVAA
jgi:hypothetical protein